MTGLFGGTITGSALQEMGDLLEHREWYGREGFEDGDFGPGVVHHGADSPGHAAVDGDGYRGVVYGGVGNLEAFGDAETLLERVLDDPEGTLAEMDGPCALATYDASADRFVEDRVLMDGSPVANVVGVRTEI